MIDACRIASVYSFQELKEAAATLERFGKVALLETQCMLSLNGKSKVDLPKNIDTVKELGCSFIVFFLLNCSNKMWRLQPAGRLRLLSRSLEIRALISKQLSGWNRDSFVP